MMKIFTIAAILCIPAVLFAQNQPPVASASASPASGNAPLKVQFTGSGTDSDGQVVYYHWDFNDGGIAYQQEGILSGVTYYVNNVTGNDTSNNGLSESAPFRTFAKTMSLVNQGDTVKIINTGEL